MAFWNRKEEAIDIPYDYPPSEVSAKDMLTELKETIRLSSESTERLIKSNQEVAKALNAATREFKKSKA